MAIFRNICVGLRISILKILNVFLWLKFSPALILQKLSHSWMDTSSICVPIFYSITNLRRLLKPAPKTLISQLIDLINIYKKVPGQVIGLDCDPGIEYESGPIWIFSLFGAIMHQTSGPVHCCTLFWRITIDQDYMHYVASLSFPLK